MKDYTKKQRTLIILGVAVFILIGSGLTYAALTWATSKPINIGLTSGCFEINYTPGGAINNASVEVMDENQLISSSTYDFTIREGIALTYANIGIKSSCKIEGYGSLYLNVASLSNAFTTGESKGSLKYAILKNDSSSTTLTVAGLLNQSFEIVKKGSITSTGKQEIFTKQLTTTQDKYLIVFYIDGSLIGNDVVGASFSGTISAEASQGKVEPKYFAKHINSLFEPDDVVTNRGTDYDYDTTNYLMKDIGGNVRYYGSVPNNYVYFNCQDYSNQSSSTCETWRIIGVFGDKIKIVNVDSGMNNTPFDSGGSSTNAGFGNHNWSKSTLMRFLNPGYYNYSVAPGNPKYVTGSLYWSAAPTGSCYVGINETTNYCDLSKKGLQNNETRSLISENIWQIPSLPAISFDAAGIYKAERDEGWYINRDIPSTWTGKIALPYVSDYAYASDFNNCDKQLSEYNNDCQNWMSSTILDDMSIVLLNTSLYSEHQGYPPVWTANIHYGIKSYYDRYSEDNDYYHMIVFPTLYLNYDVDIQNGSGTSSDPYQLLVQ